MLVEVTLVIIITILLVKILLLTRKTHCVSKVCLVGKTALVTGGSNGESQNFHCIRYYICSFISFIQLDDYFIPVTILSTQVPPLDKGYASWQKCGD